MPFHYVGAHVWVGFPDPEDQPPKGKSNVCANSDFRGRKVQLTNPETDAQVTVWATGSYKCTPFKRHPDIQLSSDDAKELFVGPRHKYEKAVAIALGF